MSEVKDTQVAGTRAASGPHVSYLVRRETHSSRAIAAVVLAILVLAACVYLAIEGILSMAGQKPLLATPTEMVHQLVAGPKAVPGAWIPIGVVIAIIGLIFLVKALAPGTLGRHSIPDQRVAYVVDDSVIASALSRAVRQQAGVPAGQVSTSVDRKQITVTVNPTSGQTLNGAELQDFAAAQVKRYKLDPDPAVKVNIAEEGVVTK